MKRQLSRLRHFPGSDTPSPAVSTSLHSHEAVVQCKQRFSCDFVRFGFLRKLQIPIELIVLTSGDEDGRTEREAENCFYCVPIVNGSSIDKRTHQIRHSFPYLFHRPCLFLFFRPRYCPEVSIDCEFIAIITPTLRSDESSTFTSGDYKNESRKTDTKSLESG